MMADAGHAPHVVHGPYHGFPHVAYTLHLFERHCRLVDPVDKYGVGFLHERVAVYVHACGGCGDFEKVTAVEAVTHHYACALADKTPASDRTCAELVHVRIVACLVEYEHVCLVAKFVQSFHQSVGHNRSASEEVVVAEQYDTFLFHNRHF